LAEEGDERAFGSAELAAMASSDYSGRMKRIIFLAVIAVPVLAFAEGGLPNQPYIYVEGKAEIEKPADIVTLRFDVVARNADQAKANQEVQAKAAKILAALDARKVAQNDVIATEVRSAPQYDGNESAEPKRGKLIGYSVSRPFSVKIRELGIFPHLVDELLALGGVEFSALEAGRADENQLHDEIYAKAVADARQRSEKNAAIAGMKIDSVFAISPVAFPEISSEIFASSQHPASASNRSLPEEGPGGPSYRVAPIVIRQSVHVIYLISPAK
jgi:uncharacterized protein YggE